MVAGSQHEELQGNRECSVFLILVERAFSQLERISKRTRVKMTLGIQEMEPHGRYLGILAVLLGRIVRRKETGENHERVQRDKQYEPSRDCALPSQAIVSVRMRGSAQYKSRSARKFPPTRKSVERTTPPITTYKSRARMASSRNGPSPGQLITTSMRSEPLSSVPTLNPNREISGFAAAGRAYRESRTRRGMPCPSA